MEKSEADNDSTSCGVCEKVYSAVAGHSAFRATNRKSSGRSQTPIVVGTNIADPKQPLKEAPAAYHQQAGPAQAKEMDVPDKHKEMVAKHPIVLVSQTITNGGLTIRPPQSQMIESSRNPTRKPTSVFVQIQGPEVSVPAPKQQKEIVKNNMIAVQGTGPAAKTTAPHIIVHEEKPKPAKSTISKSMSRKTDPGQDKKEGDKFSDYITQFKDKMTTKSDVAEMDENGRLYTNRNRVATRRGSFNDKVARYINRARMNIRTTTSNVVGSDGTRAPRFGGQKSLRKLAVGVPRVGCREIERGREILQHKMRVNTEREVFVSLQYFIKHLKREVLGMPL